MLSNLLLIGSCASSLSPLLSINPYNLQHLLFIKLSKSCGGNHLLMILLCKKQTGLLQSLTIEIVGVFEDLADRVYADVLSKDVLTLSFNGLDVVTVSKL
jgi:hypothetical protein